ncbi:hypothetical protein FEM03_01400 [Phragmitibacter flavus]|uniref:DUF4157 domain-containing protein n=1 Tax=Phragmitibacter flavus TaxID=2576071 RepID=A0A5R8KKA9_9BACT|nr:hypothetical protein [Phragmitibacter flavus]TLD72758.1 hypothetical protein FEM03_01400 [Phragmitibacter flavus]
MLTSLTLRLAMPVAVVWANRQLAVIQQLGEPLTDEQLQDATDAGVRFPEKVRVRVVNPVPLPVPTIFRSRMGRWGWVPDDVAGMAIGYGIHLHPYWGTSREVLVHELAHVGQYERLGGIRGFLESYLRECLEFGYPNGPLEQEAIAVQRAFKFRDHV